MDQAAADLEEAIERYLRAVGGQPGLLLDWVLVTHKVTSADDGSSEATTSFTMAERQTQYRTLGLLEYATSALRTQIADTLKGLY